jgi:hypothetical protein
MVERELGRRPHGVPATPTLWGNHYWIRTRLGRIKGTEFILVTTE